MKKTAVVLLLLALLSVPVFAANRISVGIGGAYPTVGVVGKYDIENFSIYAQAGIDYMTKVGFSAEVYGAYNFARADIGSMNPLEVLAGAGATFKTGENAYIAPAAIFGVFWNIAGTNFTPFAKINAGYGIGLNSTYKNNFYFEATVGGLYTF